MRSIDINCDLGEGFGRYQVADDQALLQLISSCNIACGSHAGDPGIIYKTITDALKNDVRIGAHPSYPDLQGFGRRMMPMSSDELFSNILFQISAVRGMTESAGGTMTHVKPHGALYNESARSKEIARTVYQAIAALDNKLTVYGFPESVHQEVADELGLTFLPEGFADRRYQEDGSLVARSEPGAVLKDNVVVCEQVLQLVKEKSVMTSSGRFIPMNVRTVCVHSDTPGSVGLVKSIRDTLEGHGIVIQ